MERWLYDSRLGEYILWAIERVFRVTIVRRGDALFA